MKYLKQSNTSSKTIHKTLQKQRGKNLECHQEENNRTSIDNKRKGKTTVIIHQQAYNKIINDFIQPNQYTQITQNAMKQHQNNVKRTIKQTTKQCPKHPPPKKKQQWRYYNMNPETSNLCAIIKIHKTPITI
jgi:hypothetical protein